MKITRSKLELFFMCLIMSWMSSGYIRSLYWECKLGHLGIEREAVVSSVPLQYGRQVVKYLYVYLDGEYIPVSISGPDYHRKRFKKGQIIRIKYHAASRKGKLSGEFNWRNLIFVLFLGGIAGVFWYILFTRADEDE